MLAELSGYSTLPKGVLCASGRNGYGTSTGQTGSSMFGTNTGATSSLFGQTSATGASWWARASIAAVGTTVPFNPPNGEYSTMKRGVTTNINTKHQCITAMKEYGNKSLEELRMEDYSTNRKSRQACSTSTLGLFRQTPSTQENTGFVFGRGLRSGLHTSTTGFGTSSGFRGSSAFGVQTPLAGGSLFGSGAKGTTGNTGGGLFGSVGGTGFGQTQNSCGFSFGANTTGNTGRLFGGTSQAKTGTSSLFSTPAAGTGFGARPGGFTGFGTSAGQTGSSLFGTNTGATSSLFGQTGAFCWVSTIIAAVGTTVPFNPPYGEDTMMKSGATTNINTKHQCITAMKEYENKSLEELRMEDYSANRKSRQAGSTSTGGVFGQTPSTQANTGFVF